VGDVGAGISDDERDFVGMALRIERHLERVDGELYVAYKGDEHKRRRENR
jgi:hypothetical protein